MVEVGRSNPDNVAEASKQLGFNFLRFAACFAVNHACSTTPLHFATSSLDFSVGYLGNGALYVVTALSSLLISGPVIGRYGAKGSLLIAQGLYTLYCGSFALANFFHEYGTELLWLEKVVFVTGSVIGGVAAGILWPAQGSYFSSSADLMMIIDGVPRETVTARLASTFANFLLFVELVKLGFVSALLDAGFVIWEIGLLYCCLGLAAMFAFVGAFRFALIGELVPVKVKLRDTLVLWRDPCLWALSGTNLTFGFSSSFLIGYISGTFTESELGSSVVALMSGLTACTAFLCTWLFGLMSSRHGGKGLAVSIGMISCFGLPSCLFFFGCCEEWGFRLTVLYLLQGPCRAAFESTNRAVFADFFPGLATDGAFANCSLQSSFAAAFCFLGASQFGGRLMGMIVLVLSALTPLGYFSAKYMRRQCPLSASSLEADLQIDGPLSSNAIEVRALSTPGSTQTHLDFLEAPCGRSMRRQLSGSTFHIEYPQVADD